MKRRWLFIGIPVSLLVLAWFWPLPAQFEESAHRSTRITDREGRLLYDVRQGGLQRGIAAVDIPGDFRKAVIAVEDRTFETNAGLSLRGIARAAVKDLAALRVVQGGSTITQQFVRSILKPEKRGVLYKIREAWLAVKITARWRKDDIFAAYANTAYFGQQAYGISAAARTYFDKSPEHLSLAENALLAGLLNAPSALNPFKDLTSATSRRLLVLHALRDTEMITQEEFDVSVTEPVRLTRGVVPIEAPHFVFWLLGEHPELRSAGREIRTTLDLSLQHEVESAVRLRIADLADKKVTSAAVIVLDAKSGDILSMVGSADYFDAEHDGAVNVVTASRQPGSALKPFTYALAFTQGMTPATTIADISAQFLTKTGDPYVPRNYDYSEHGLVRLREALANSYNIPAVKLTEKIGVERLQNFLIRAGFTTLTESPDHYGLALTLGDAEVKLIDLAAAYGMLARNGETLRPRGLLEGVISPGNRVLDPKVAWLITDILSDSDARAAEFGRGGPLAFAFPVAAKTGTTRNSRDNWTVGYTPDVIVGVWVGNADNSPMRDTTGVTGAGPIFHDVIVEVTRQKAAHAFERPDGIVEREICRLSGLLPTDLCTDRTTEHFIAGTEPVQKDTLFTLVKIDTRNGKRAGASCPPEVIREVPYTDFPPEVRKWARENGWKLPPQDASPLCADVPAGASSGVFVITRPAPGTSYLLDPLIPDAQESVIFEGRTDGHLPEVDWYVDGRYAGTGKSPDYRFPWRPSPGIHEIRAGTGVLSRPVSIEVRR